MTDRPDDPDWTLDGTDRTGGTTRVAMSYFVSAAAAPTWPEACMVLPLPAPPDERPLGVDSVVLAIPGEPPVRREVHVPDARFRAEWPLEPALTLETPMAEAPADAVTLADRRLEEGSDPDDREAPLAAGHHRASLRNRT